MRSIVEMSKKGQVGNLAPAILALVFAAIVLVMGLIIQQSITNTRIGSVTSGTVVNETVTVGNITGSGTVARFGQNIGWGTWNASRVMNTTPSTVTLVEGTHYRIFGANGTIVNGSTDSVNTKNWRVTYTYTWGDEAFTGGNATVVGLGAFADFWEIIVLAIVISIVIGLLLVVFGGGRAR